MTKYGEPEAPRLGSSIGYGHPGGSFLLIRIDVMDPDGASRCASARCDRVKAKLGIRRGLTQLASTCLPFGFRPDRLLGARCTGMSAAASAASRRPRPISLAKLARCAA